MDTVAKMMVRARYLLSNMANLGIYVEFHVGILCTQILLNHIFPGIQALGSTSHRHFLKVNHDDAVNYMVHSGKQT